MAYNYQTQRANLFTESGQVMFLAIRDKAKALLKTAGAFRMQEATMGFSGDSWDQLACIDRLVELGEIKELTIQEQVMGQHRVFTY